MLTISNKQKNVRYFPAVQLKDDLTTLQSATSGMCSVEAIRMNEGLLPCTPPPLSAEEGWVVGCVGCEILSLYISRGKIIYYLKQPAGL